MSTNPSSPTMGWGYLTVDGAFTTTQLDQTGATAGSKFVVVDYQLLGAEGGNFFDQAFQMEADGQLYSPVSRINEIIGAGVVNNATVTFEIPATAATVQLRGGVPLDSVDGFSTQFDIVFSPADATAAADPVIPDATIEAQAWDIEQTSQEATMSTNLTAPANGSGELTIDSAVTTARIDGDGAGPEWKFVIIDYQVLGLDTGNLFQSAFRLKANDELYPSVTRLNEIVGPGTVFNGSVVFRVPRSAVELELRAGTDGFSR